MAGTPETSGRGVAPRAFWLLSTIGFLYYFAIGSTSPFYALYVQALGGTVADLGWVIGGYSVAVVVANLTSGRLLDRLPRRKPFLVGPLVVLVVILLLAARAPGWAWLVPLRLMEGLAAGTYNVAALAVLGDLLAESGARGRQMGLYRTGGSLAFAIAITTAGSLSAARGLSGVFIQASIVYALAAVCAFVLPDRPLGPTAGRSTATARLGRGPRPSLRPMLPFVLAVVAWSVPFNAVYSVWPVYVADQLGLGQEIYARLWGLAAFCEVPSMVVAGMLADRLGRRRMFGIAMALFALIYVGYTVAVTAWGFAPAQVVRGLAYAGFTATALTAVVELAPPEARGQAAGLYQLVLGLAQIVGNASGGPLAAQLGFRRLFLGAAALTAVGAAAVLLSGERSTPPKRPLPDQGIAVAPGRHSV